MLFPVECEEEFGGLVPCDPDADWDVAVPEEDGADVVLLGAAGGYGSFFFCFFLFFVFKIVQRQRTRLRKGNGENERITWSGKKVDEKK